jgi:transposase
MGFRLYSMDVLTLSHGELIGLVRRQQALITELQATVQSLERRLRELEGGDAPPRGMPGHKREQAAAQPRPARRKRTENHARPRSEPTARVEHALDHCPDCGARLAGGAVKRTREVIEVVPVPATVTEHRYLERCCPDCGKRWTPAVDLTGQVVGQSRLGVRLLSLIATLRGEWRLPLGAIQQSLASIYGLRLSVGGIVGALGQVARVGAATVADTLAAIRGSPVVHADETGWREDGVNRYLWSFSTPTHRYYAFGRREKGIVDQVLGPDFRGVLVSDFYAAYDHYDGLQQKCWVHLLRDIHTLTRQHPDDAELAVWATAVHGSYTRAVTTASALTDASEEARRQARWRLQTELRETCQPFLDPESDAPQARLCRRIAKYLHALFIFVLVPGVPSDNNPAERSVRHEVISRKISGGTRSTHGTQTRMTLATLFGTWRAQGRDPYQSCRILLTSPQV